MDKGRDHIGAFISLRYKDYVSQESHLQLDGYKNTAQVTVNVKKRNQTFQQINALIRILNFSCKVGEDDVFSNKPLGVGQRRRKRIHSVVTQWSLLKK